MVNIGDSKGRETENVKTVRAVFADLDGAPLEPVLAAGPAPHAVVESSPGRWHVYWQVEGCPLPQFGLIQRAIALRFKSDTSVIDLPRVMRIPGFWHLKSAPFQVRIERLGDHPPFAVDDLIASLGLDLQRGSTKPTARSPTDLALSFGDQTLTQQAEVLTLVKKALTFVPSDDRHVWVKVGHCLKELGKAGKDIWDQWSETSPKFDEDGQSAWETFKPKKSGWKGIIPLARLHGFRPSRDSTSVGSGLSDDAVYSSASSGGFDATVPQTIEIRKGERSAIVAELAYAFAAASAPYFRRESILTRAITLPAEEEVAGIRRSKGAVVLSSVRSQAVIADASKYARTIMYDGRSKSYKACDLPEPVAQSFCELGIEQNVLPSVVGVIRCPIMREDGSLLLKPGYDPDSRLILAGNEGWASLCVPDRPTRDDAMDQLTWVRNTIYKDFPYADTTSASVAISSLLTAVLRPAMDCAPLHGFSAPQYGAGKSLQAAIAAVVATGVMPAMVAPGHSQEEFEKRVDAAILAADPIVILDNMSRPITGDNLCVSLTSAMAVVRPLGSSNQIRVPTSSFWMATGTNLGVMRDMQRRAVICCVDAKMERPELRSGFAIPNLIGWVAEHRMAILSSVFTILRAHAHAGYPTGEGTALGGFEIWSRRVAHALTWLDMPNPLLSQQQLRSDDAELQGRAALFRAIFSWQEERSQMNRAWTMRELSSAGYVSPASKALTECVTDHVRKGFEGLSVWLQQNRNVVCGGFRLAADGKAGGGVNRWLISSTATS